MSDSKVNREMHQKNRLQQVKQGGAERSLKFIKKQMSSKDKAKLIREY